MPPWGRCPLALGTHLLLLRSARGAQPVGTAGKSSLNGRASTPGPAEHEGWGAGGADNIRGGEGPALTLFCLSPALGASVG